MADKKRKAEKTFEDNSMLGKINKARKERDAELRRAIGLPPKK